MWGLSSIHASIQEVEAGASPRGQSGIKSELQVLKNKAGHGSIWEASGTCLEEHPTQASLLRCCLLRWQEDSVEAPAGLSLINPWDHVMEKKKNHTNCFLTSKCLPWHTYTGTYMQAHVCAHTHTCNKCKNVFVETGSVYVALAVLKFVI